MGCVFSARPESEADGRNKEKLDDLNKTGNDGQAGIETPVSKTYTYRTNSRMKIDKSVTL